MEREYIGETQEFIKALKDEEVPDRNELLLTATRCLDLTSLESTDTSAKIKRLCERAINPLPGFNVKVACVCVYPVFVEECLQLLMGTGVRVATVCGYFPSGMMDYEMWYREAEFMVKKGVHELDIVINRGHILEGKYDKTGRAIRKIKEICGDDVVLKVILENCDLETPERIKRASEICLHNGADFLKTSTGKGKYGARPEDVLLMCQVIKQFWKETGQKRGIKCAGGISTPDDAILMMKIVRGVLGEEWLVPSHFRIGASRLLDAIAEELLEKRKRA